MISALWLWPMVALADPAPDLTRRRTRSRRLDCERLSDNVGSVRYPGLIFVPQARGREDERTVVVCTERFMRPGLRQERDEAVLSTLETRASTLAAAAAALRPELSERTWLVEAFFPSGPVSSKIAFATKNAMMGLGLTVSDRTPKLGAGEIGVLTRMPPFEAYPAACERYHLSGTMDPSDVLLAVLVLDPRETTLHAGVCASGRFEWLQ